MNHDQIKEFKASLEAELKRLDSQRNGVLATLESISRMEASYFDDVMQAPLVPKRRIYPIENGIPMPEKTPTSRARILDALQKTSGKFSRMDILKTANSDGLAEINENTFGWIFADLVKKGVIREFEKSAGSQPGAYMRSDEYKMVLENTPDK